MGQAAPRTIARPFREPTPQRVREFLASIPRWAADTDDPTFLGFEPLRRRRDELLRRQVGWLLEASPYYREKFRAEGIGQGDIESLADLRRLSPTTKAEYMADPDRFRLTFAQPSLYDTVHSLMYTTGTTTGRPSPYPLTGHDMLGAIQGNVRGVKIAYLIPGDVVVSTFPFSPTAHLTLLSPHFFNSAGLAYISAFTGSPYAEFPIHNPASVVPDVIERTRPTMVSGVGSFLRRMLRDAAQAGRDFSSVSIVYVAGEVCTRLMRDDMRKNLGLCGAEDAFIATPYSCTESALPWTECRELGWLHNAAPDQIYFEILDPDSGEPAAPGERGLVALSHLNRRGSPLLRYLLGDLAAMVEEPCPDCGRQTQSLVITEGSSAVSRTTDLTKVRGTLINPALLQDVVGGTPGVLEYQIIFAKEDQGDPLSEDLFVVRVACEQGQDRVALDAALRDRVFNAAELRPRIEFADPSEIYDPSVHFKAARVVDRRPRE